jgi:hypothetical protein
MCKGSAFVRGEEDVFIHNYRNADSRAAVLGVMIIEVIIKTTRVT